MGKLVAWMMTTLDGYHEGPDRAFDFWTIDADFNDLSVQLLDEADTLVFGRVTYDAMAAYWPDVARRGDDHRIAKQMNTTPKVVVSTTLTRATWHGTEIVRTVQEVADRKQRSSDTMTVMGSSSLVTALMDAELIDEVRVLVNPIILGHGHSAFRGATTAPLTLLETRAFPSGNLLATYRPTASGATPGP